MVVYVVNQVFVRITHVFYNNRKTHVIHKKHVQEMEYVIVSLDDHHVFLWFIGLYIHGFMLL